MGHNVWYILNLIFTYIGVLIKDKITRDCKFSSKLLLLYFIDFIRNLNIAVNCPVNCVYLFSTVLIYFRLSNA